MTTDLVAPSKPRLSCTESRLHMHQELMIAKELPGPANRASATLRAMASPAARSQNRKRRSHPLGPVTGIWLRELGYKGIMSLWP